MRITQSAPSGTDRAGREATRRDPFQHAQRDRLVACGAAHVLRPRGEPVHRAVVPGRLIDRRADLGRGRAAERIDERDALGR
jgi:hypothetical protein